MGQYSSYYLYQKYEKRGSQDWIPCVPNVYSITGDSTNPMSASAKSECDPQCGCSTVQYRWVNIDPSIDWYCDDCGGGGGGDDSYTFTWQDGSESKTTFGARGSNGVSLSITSTKNGSLQGFRIESTVGWEGVTDARYLPSTASSSSLGTYLAARYPTNTSGEDKQYQVTLIQEGSGNRIYLFLTVQKWGDASEDFFFEDTPGDTINMRFERNYPSTGYAEFVISNYGGSNTGFSFSTDVNWLSAVNDGYVAANNYYKIHYFPTGATEQERSGTITLTQYGSGNKLYINVTQAGTGCTTASTTCYSNIGNVTASEVAGTATTNTITWDWTGTTTTRTTACTSADTTVTGTASTNVSFSTNYGDSARTVSGSALWSVPTCTGGTGINIPYSFTQRRACQPVTYYCYSSVSNATGETAPAAATSNTITWTYEGTKTVRNIECEEVTTPITGTSSALVTMPLNYESSAITVSGTYQWRVNTCTGGTSISVPYSFTQKSAREGQVYIHWQSSYNEIITISRLIITFQGSSTKYYFNVYSGPIYPGSESASWVQVIFSTANKMSSMEAEYTSTGEQGTQTKKVYFPGAYTYGRYPTFIFSSAYFQGGAETTFTISPN